MTHRAYPHIHQYEESKRLKQPRLYSVEIVFTNKTVNIMLGVAFNMRQKQRYYHDYIKKFKSWGNQYQYRVSFKSEVLESK